MNKFEDVSIPQAVGTIAITFIKEGGHLICRFNTASGRYYCNVTKMAVNIEDYSVSIPQAVGTIAIAFIEEDIFAFFLFQYRKR